MPESTKDLVARLRKLADDISRAYGSDDPPEELQLGDLAYFAMHEAARRLEEFITPRQGSSITRHGDGTITYEAGTFKATLNQKDALLLARMVLGGDITWTSDGIENHTNYLVLREHLLRTIERYAEGWKEDWSGSGVPATDREIYQLAAEAAANFFQPGPKWSGPNVSEHLPRRDSDVEAWIKAARDRIQESTPLGAVMVGWEQLNDLLDEYRLRADTGKRLSDELED